jgi:Holliday junction resolvasome RuvABC endonuclease subunit
VRNIKVLAIDQSTKVSGYSLWKNKELIKYGTVTSDLKESNPIERMRLMILEIQRLVSETKPNFVVFEDVQEQVNKKVFKQLAQMQGVLIGYLITINMPFTIVMPTEWKCECEIRGKKREEQKLNTQIYVKEHYGFSCNEDEADAVGVGVWANKNVSKEKV